jgi:hypothetical protein
MNSSLRSQIYSRMNLKETDELINIWQANNRTEWSEEAFEIVKEILVERGEQVPEQNQPVYKVRDQEESTKDDDGLEEWEAKVLDDEHQPELYDTLEVLDLRDNINKIAIAVVVVYTLLGVTRLSIVAAALRGIPISLSDTLQLLPNDLYILLTYGLQIVVTYFPLKALAHILRILMEMEFRSRKAI